MEDLNQLIDQRLDEQRPDRYDSDDRAWMAPIIVEIAALIPPATARQIAAEDKVHNRETQATKSANRLLRLVERTREPPLDWMDMRRRPISWEEHRVCLAECTEADLRSWAAEERRRAANDFSSRNAACEGAEWAADQMSDSSARHLGDLWS